MCVVQKYWPRKFKSGYVIIGHVSVFILLAIKYKNNELPTDIQVNQYFAPQCIKKIKSGFNKT